MSETETATGRHQDTRFPDAENSYACDHCKTGDHEDCTPKVVLIGYDFQCACWRSSEAQHLRLQPKTLTTADDITAELNSALGTDAVHVLLARALADRGYALLTPKRKARR